MQLGTALWGAAIGGLIGAVTKEDPLKYALWGGGIGLGVSFFNKEEMIHRAGLKIPAFSLPTPALPGQFDYRTDPRTDALLDPVSRRRLYPAWLLAHWQNADPKVVMDIQTRLGTSPDGALGPATTSAVAAYQARAGLPQTGNMDLNTMEAIISG
jgi:peptidoglycan hydrolase-like protein with peptidoglycan-binding domain